MIYVADEASVLDENGDNHINFFHLGRYIVVYYIQSHEIQENIDEI